MRISRIRLENFKNIAACDFAPAPGMNLLIGKNGAGKTNLVEAVWLLSGQKSFKNSKEIEMVRQGEDFARIEAEVFSGGRGKTLAMNIKNTKAGSVNGIRADRLAVMAEHFFCVVFAPQHNELTSESPEIRRAFLDGAIFSTKPAYGATMREYERILYGRNRLLKNRQKEGFRGISGEEKDSLEAYTQRLAALGARIYRARKRYSLRLAEAAPRIYEPLSGGEQLELEYRPCVETDDEQYGERLLAALYRDFEEDIRNGYTGLGPHREDMEIKIDGKKARTCASQGQKKSAALCLKLAEGEILAGAVGESPVFLLDDVMSELDRARQNYILQNLGENQIFITCCETGIIRRRADAEVFYIDNGEVRRRKTRCTST